jgi:hypothetical protein
VVLRGGEGAVMAAAGRWAVRVEQELAGRASEVLPWAVEITRRVRCPGPSGNMPWAWKLRLRGAECRRSRCGC